MQGSRPSRRRDRRQKQQHVQEWSVAGARVVQSSRNNHQLRATELVFLQERRHVAVGELFPHLLIGGLIGDFG